jgi:hypothetical protein
MVAALEVQARKGILSDNNHLVDIMDAAADDQLLFYSSSVSSSVCQHIADRLA